MSSSVVVPALASIFCVLVGGLLAGFFNLRIKKMEKAQQEAADRRDSEQTDRRIDGEQFDRITGELNRQIDTLRADLKAQQLETDGLRDQVKGMRQRMVGERVRQRALTREVHREKTWSLYLEQHLRDKGLDVPERPPVTELDDYDAEDD